MLSTAPTEARKLHDRLKHPIIDAVEKQAADVLARGAA